MNLKHLPAPLAAAADGQIIPSLVCLEALAAHEAGGGDPAPGRLIVPGGALAGVGLWAGWVGWVLVHLSFPHFRMFFPVARRTKIKDSARITIIRMMHRKLTLTGFIWIVASQTIWGI
jgi:hypothetical protein